jgi:CheY-like chemotaxis protein
VSRILLVEDSPAILASAGRVLREQGHLVTSTNNGADGVALLKTKPPPELLILDMKLKGLNGDQVLAELGPTAPPVIVITGSELQPEDFRSGQVKRVLTKPFDMTALVNVVNDALGLPSVSCLMETVKDSGGGVVMTAEQREKALERIRRLNGGPAHATG